MPFDQNLKKSKMADKIFEKWVNDQNIDNAQVWPLYIDIFWGKISIFMIIFHIWPINFKIMAKINNGGHIGNSEISYIWQEALRDSCKYLDFGYFKLFKTISTVIFYDMTLKIKRLSHQRKVKHQKIEYKK